MTAVTPTADRGSSRLLRLAGIGLVIAVAAGLVGLLGFGLTRPGKPSGSVPIIVRQAPAFALQSLDGMPIQLADFAGQPVVVNFWASWCIPCQQEAPTLVRTARQYAARGVVFIGIDVWDTASEAQQFLQRYGVDYRNAVDAGGRIAIDYGVTGIPETFFIDRQGRITRHFIGPMGDEQLAGFLDSLLATPAGPG